jgi:hypothetical protein
MAGRAPEVPAPESEETPMNARRMILTAIAAVLLPSMANAQCADWLAGPLDAGTAANGTNGQVYSAIMWTPPGGSARLVVGGYFTSIDGVPANHLAEQDPVTGTWHELGGGVGFGVRSMCVWNGELVVAGNGNSDVYTDGNIKAWDGSNWVNTFYDGTSTGSIYTVVNYNGELYIGGNFVIFPTVLDAAHNLAHWNVAHGLWENVAGPGTDPGQTVEDLVVWGSNLYAGTYYNDGSGHARGDVWSFNGSSWSSLITLDNYVDAIQPYDGLLIFGGGFQNVVGGGAMRVMMAYNGSTFSQYGAWTYGGIYSLGVFGSTLVAGGQFTVAPEGATNNIVGYNYITGLWSGLGSGCDNFVYALTSTGPDLFAGGWFLNANGKPANYMAKWSGYAWSPIGGGNVDGVVAETYYQGRLVLGGVLNQSCEPSTPAHNLVGWNGSSLGSFGTGTDGQVNALKAYNLGIGINQTHELVAGGYFLHAGGITCNYIAKWDEKITVGGNVWTAMGNGFDGAVLAIERATVNGATNTYAAGNFLHTYGGGTQLNYIARYNATSNAWEALATGADGVVYAIRAYGGYLYAGGSFTHMNGVLTGGLARWDGTSWTSVGGTFSGTVYALEAYNGVMAIGGSFPGINSSPNLAYYNGSSYGTFSTGGTSGGVVNALHAVGTKLYVGGTFTTCGGISASHCAYWDGSSWHTMTAGTDGTVYALGDNGNEVVAGGAFNVAGNAPVASPHAARFLANGGAPWYSSQPFSQTVNRGDNVTVSAVPASGYGVTERWLHNGIVVGDGGQPDGSTISGSTTSSLMIARIANAELGDWRAVSTNSCGNDSSATATLSYGSNVGVDGSHVYANVFDALGPNPSHGASMLSFTLARDAKVGIEVLDVAGRRVGGADLGQLGAGPHQAMWTARDAQGGAVRAGMYFVRLEVNGRELGTKRMTIVR